MKKEKLNIHNFPCMYVWDDVYGWNCHCIRWDDIEKVMGKQMYKKFMKWMFGQTTAVEGVYRHDLQQFLEGGESFD